MLEEVLYQRKVFKDKSARRLTVIGYKGKKFKITVHIDQYKLKLYDTCVEIMNNEDGTWCNVIDADTLGLEIPNNSVEYDEVTETVENELLSFIKAVY